LVAHNRYQQRGGEDTVVEAEVALLRAHGCEVVEYARDNHELITLSQSKAALQSFWSSRTAIDIDSLIHQHRPHVIHVHNTFPLISPAIYWRADAHRVPVVQTLHNFRLICPQALMLRHDRPCEDCVGHVPWRGVVHGCYRSSRAQTFVLAAMLSGHRAVGTWHRRITRYIALNAFCRDRFIAGGLPASRISIKPNFVDISCPPPRARKGFLFVGRLSQEKGLSVLAQSLQPGDLGEAVSVIGEGPQGQMLTELPGARLLGALPSNRVYDEMASARALVLPSIWYENFPRTLVEAFACGLPVIASRLGAMATLIDDGVNGLLFEAGNAEDLRAKMAWCLAHPDRTEAMGSAARKTYETHLTPAANMRMLADVYEAAIRERLAEDQNG